MAKIMNIEDFEEYEQINSAIVNIFDKMDNNSKIKSMLEYLYISGGKKIRPIILLLCTDICKGEKNKSINAAIAVELIHAASLVHDDMLDGGIIRRGFPSLHKKYGSSAALLCGDYLISMAITLISSYDPQVVYAFGKMGMDMAEGETLDISSSNELFEKEDYFECVYKKTASLFAYSAFIGAVNAHSEKDNVDTLFKFGLNLGIAYQLVDDLLEFSSSVEDKQSIKDVSTLPKIYFRTCDYDTSVQKTKNHIKKYINNAKTLLDNFDTSYAKDKLLLITNYITSDTIKNI